MDVERLVGSPTSVKVAEVAVDTPSIKTLVFEHGETSLTGRPGQFLMVSISGVDEIPMSISHLESDTVGITIQPIGEATEALVSMRAGDWLGVRGPFGTHFSIDAKRPLVVGGGIGMAPLRPLMYSLIERGIETTLLIAAKTKDDLVFYKEFNNIPGVQLLASTDNGSLGFKGLATEATRTIIADSKFDTIYTCGPELMMKGLLDIATTRGMKIQASLERYMKCGCGICGTCAMDPTGILVCIEGPVLNGEQITELSEFGSYHRNSTGTKVNF